MGTAPLLTPDVEDVTEQAPDDVWMCMLHDDPVNLMGFVSMVIQEVFGYDADKAAQIMLEAHTHGRAVAASGERTEMEGYATKLGAHQLWATVERDS